MELLGSAKVWKSRLKLLGAWLTQYGSKKVSTLNRRRISVMRRTIYSSDTFTLAGAGDVVDVLDVTHGSATTFANR